MVALEMCDVPIIICRHQYGVYQITRFLKPWKLFPTIVLSQSQMEMWNFWGFVQFLVLFHLVHLGFHLLLFSFSFFKIWCLNPPNFLLFMALMEFTLPNLLSLGTCRPPGWHSSALFREVTGGIGLSGFWQKWKKNPKILKIKLTWNIMLIKITNAVMRCSCILLTPVYEPIGFRFIVTRPYFAW